jgi:hypothetical protein
VDLNGDEILLGRHDDGATTMLALVNPDNYEIMGSWKGIGMPNWVPVP